MEKDNIFEETIAKLKSGMKFGLLEDGKTCYLEDGTQVSYAKLWSVLTDINSQKSKTYGPLFEQCLEDENGMIFYKYVEQ